MLLKFHSNQFSSPFVSISSSTMELLEWVKLKTNMGKIKGKKNYNPAKYKDSYTYIVKHVEAIQLVGELLPYLIIKSKKKRANLLLDRYKKVTTRKGRYSPEMLELKNTFYNEFMAIK